MLPNIVGHGNSRPSFWAEEKAPGSSPTRIVTDKLSSDSEARKELMSSMAHCQERYAIKRCEESHEHIREQEHQTPGFQSPGHAQRFLAVRGEEHNVFHVERHLLRTQLSTIYEQERSGRGKR